VGVEVSRLVFAMLTAAALLVSGVAAAQEPAPAGELSSVTMLREVSGATGLFSFDYGPPKSPAMTLLGLDADASPPSTSLKAFVVAASNLGGAGGQSATLDIAPAALFDRIENFDRYIADDNYMYRLARRSRIGVAVINGSKGEDAVQSGVALGFSASLLDNSDPLRAQWLAGAKRESFAQCIDRPRASLASAGVEELDGRLATRSPAQDVLIRSQRSLAGAYRPDADRATKFAAIKAALAQMRTSPGLQVPNDPPAAIDDAELAVLLAELTAQLDGLIATYNAATSKSFETNPAIVTAQRQIDACQLRASRAASFATDLDVGIGWVWRGKPGELAGFKSNGGAAWVAFHHPIMTETRQNGDITAAWLVGASGRFGWKDTVATGDTAAPNFRANTLDGWFGIERRSDALILAVRYGYYQARATEALDRPFNRSGDRFQAQGQFRLGNESPLWLGVTYGNAAGTIDGFNAKQLLVTLAFSPAKPYNITNRSD
jgi:hypothetical protein